ncbi:hypothetical protein THRCLA_03461 [Thraustotheca clavata]|uniref:Thioredoxin domain-containing protein n=1 Tax=Thraustotheca clavata TaxID=74557 RepID=A0A1W0A1Y6_9STRA|nr:hypothetical protein THRCLA_03461 [Thraustotheca clavata]
MARGGRGGGGQNNAKELKLFLEHRMWRDHWMAISVVFAIIAALFVGFFVQFSYSETRVHMIQLDDDTHVHRVFKSGEPWVILCANPDSVLPEVFDKASERLVGKVNVGVLDCNDLLPSGKSVYNKFGIRRDISPTIFTVANGEKPKQIFLNYLQKSKALASQAIAQTAKEFHELQTTTQLQEKCLSKSSPCVLVYRGKKKFETFQKKWIKELMHNHRLVKFAWADSTILKLSAESLVKGFKDHSVMLFVKSKNESNPTTPILHAKGYNSYFDQLPVAQFISTNVQATAFDNFKTLTKPVTLKRRVKKQPTIPKENTKSNTEVEQERRERMEEEGKRRFAQSIDEDSDTIVEEEEETILDLDEL